MQKKKGSEDCEAKEEKNRCSNECGLGWCIKNGDKQGCSCNTTFSVYNTEKGKCVLKKTLCASRLLTDDLMKCKCTGIYKYASNGITCEKRSCADDDAQKDCKEKSAGKCEDKWTDQQIPYKCRCTGDYKEDSHNNDICTEPCSLFKIKAECGGKGKVCYLNDKAEGNCVCPPPFKNEGTCSTLGEYVHKLQNVRVLKKRYIKSESVIDIISLTKDIQESMKTMYMNLKDAYLYNHRLDKDIISCDIWLEFKKNASEEVSRFDKQGVSDVECDNCIKDVVLLPPSLLLEKGSIKNVTEEEMDVCSASEALCGPYADCKNNKCSCREGFQISEYGARQGKTFTIVRCEDIDECKKGTHSCSANTTCQNTIGSYNCICKPGYKKKDEKKVTYKYELNKDPCVDLCTPNPCGDNGVCSISDDKMFDCKCKTGYEGTLCDRNNVAYANAKTATTVVGAVLGVILAICLIAFFLYVRRVRKNSDSEDFSPVPTRQDNAEMTERRQSEVQRTEDINER
ncbi:neurogenic locus notch homolog protein 2-like [Stegodyphus dumicola]|uniref:neurogenic locus notch homolog protein 2-like n=1 Tax=Stegodyphus dumicola TaxID=202533 RepID=UPI0015AD5959|nr:neurogenic locus notch homolog protein 2-like [Stegodyphus dumicola]